MWFAQLQVEGCIYYYCDGYHDFCQDEASGFRNLKTLLSALQDLESKISLTGDIVIFHRAL